MMTKKNVILQLIKSCDRSLNTEKKLQKTKQNHNFAKKEEEEEEEKRFKGIVSDSNNILLRYKPHDINKKMLFPNSNFTITSYALLCALALPHKLMC